MTTQVIQRPARRAAPPLPSGELPIDAPPTIPQPSATRWQQYLMVLPMLAGTAATAMMFGGREGAGAYTYVVGGIFGLSTLGMLIMNWGGANAPRKAELMNARRDYLRYLAGVRERVRATIADQRLALAYRHPDPQTLWSHAMGPRVWERRAADADFGVVRVGLGPQALAAALVPPTVESTTDLEPVTAGALHRFLNTYSVVDDMPVSIAVQAFTTVLVVGDSEESHAAAGGRRALVRAIIGQLATFHAPDDLLVACVCAAGSKHWDWLKWLPHARHPSRQDALGHRRLVVHSLADADDLLADLVGKRPRHQAGAVRSGEPVATPHIVLVVDGVDMRNSVTVGGGDAGPAGVTVLHLDAVGARPVQRSTIALRVDRDGGLRSVTAEGEREVGRADQLSLPEVDSLARRLAPLRLSAAVREQVPLATDRDLAELLGLPDIARVDIGTLWARRPPRDHLRIPIGVGADGAVVQLDLKEAAEAGMGPHGMIVGATGSGKSELLRTLVLGLAATHSSETLNFVLVDFKGGATFANLDRLPHTSAVITNLADELPLVDRMHDALTGELTRRQEVLRRAGSGTNPRGFASLRDYERARSTDPALPPLPSLLIVCDEFTELLIARPEFIDVFLQIGRIGRSIGVHLLLATQRLEEGRLRGLDANLSYRIALRTFSTLESRSLIGNGDAANLPAAPGHGFLAVGTEPPRRFRAAYVSGPHISHPTAVATPATVRMHDFVTGHTPAPTPIDADPLATAPDARAGEHAPSLMDVIVGRLEGQGRPAHRVWLPPLHDSPALGDLLGGLVVAPGRGLTTADPSSRGTLRVPVAIVDRPIEQRRETAWLDLSGAAGHVAIAGGPQSGKSTLVRTLVTALALTHSPVEVHVYCLDFGGGTLTALRDLPHVGGVAGRLDPAAVRRTVGEVATMLTERERRAAAVGEHGGTVDAHVFLIIDGWATIRAEFEDLEPVLADVATRSLNYGLHLVVTATRWYDFRQNVKDLFGSTVELRLGDPADSSVNRRLAADVPAGVAGRGLTADGLHLLTALPVAAPQSPVGSGKPEDATIRTPQPWSDGPSALVRAVADNWQGPRAPAVRLLPAVLPYSALLVTDDSDEQAPVGTGLSLPIGVAESDLRPVLLDFGNEPHLLVFGDECGKSSLLRCLAESIVRRFSPAEARIILVDYRRTSLGAVTSEHLIGYGMEADHTAALIASAADYLRDRRPGPEVTAEQLRSRSWWDGPELFVLVDDYDMVATGGNPIAPLGEFLAQARDVGLHLVLARRAGGAGRSLYDPLIQRLRELRSPGLVLNGDRDEGALVGTVRPSTQPPGRGYLVTAREGARLVQLAQLPGERDSGAGTGVHGSAQ